RGDGEVHHRRPRGEGSRGVLAAEGHQEPEEREKQLTHRLSRRGVRSGLLCFFRKKGACLFRWIRLSWKWHSQRSLPSAVSSLPQAKTLSLRIVPLGRTGRPPSRHGKEIICMEENRFEIPKADYFTLNYNVYCGSLDGFNYQLNAGSKEK